MRNEQDALALADRLVALAGKHGDQVSVRVDFDTSSYARFARNYVTQNLTQSSGTVSLGIAQGKRVGRSSTSDLSDAGLTALVSATADIAARVPANREFVSFATKAPLAVPVKSVFDSTANATPDARVDKLVPVFARMTKSDLNCSGYTSTTTGVVAIANSLGVRASSTGTIAGLEIKAMAPATSGFASYFSRDYAAIDSAENAEIAAAKATVSKEPQDLAPGTYTVILEPPAFVDCINNLYDGMNIGSVLEDQDSWMVGRIGKRILSPNLTIVDDWSHPLMANAPFSGDGAPTRRVTLVENGVPKEYVSSTYLANKFKKPNTGHDGYPTNAIVMPGTKTRAQLIASIERGILISRTWYTRTVDPREATITGLTRDGVFLIENGKITKTLKNFRFFTSMLAALSDVEFGEKLYLAESSDAPSLLAVPDAKIAKFTLSAQTSFA